MQISGWLSHIDLCVADPSRSIPFYDVLLIALGYERWREAGDEWHEPNPHRAAWGKCISGAFYFGIDLRPTPLDALNRRHDRYGPGPHHLAFHAGERSEVDRIYRLLLDIDAVILDPPEDYGGRPGYGRTYYAVFFEDPDGLKLEILWAPGFGPPKTADDR